MFWQDDSTAIVMYICAGEMVYETLPVSDTLRIHRTCDTSSGFFLIPSDPPSAPAVFTGVSRIMAVSDIHGEYAAFVDVLKVSGVIDSTGNWAFGDGHLVVNGDVVDRGDGVTESLWLVYRLEQEARAAGGEVHFTLGNHEKMVIRGDNRYVHDKYLKGTVKKSRIRHEDLYGPDTELGRWLRTKPTMIRINDILFVHGGLSPEMVERDLTMEGTNLAMRIALDMNSNRVAFSDLPKFLLGSKGPLWYRGMLTALEDSYERLDSEEVAGILGYYGVSSVIIGHSEQNEIGSHYSGLVYNLDVPLDELACFQALLWEQGKFYRISCEGEREAL